MSDVVLAAHQVTRHYRVGSDLIVALGGVSLTIEAGEFVALMGASGSGKSTLLNLIGGLDRPTSGTIRIGDQDLATSTEEQLARLRRAELGFIFQRHDLFPALTAIENVAFPLLLAGVPELVRHERAQALLEQVGLSRQADFLPDELSGGQQQRVGIARALISRPRILLADEPTGNLDSVTAREIMDQLDGLRRSFGLTLIVVTHDPAVAKYADRILQLADGQIVSPNGHRS